VTPTDRRDQDRAREASVGGHEPESVTLANNQAALTTAMRRWDLVADGRVVETASGCVAFVRRGADRLVLKVIGAASDEMQALPAYAHFGGHGAVKLLAQAGRALLLERIEPGDALTRRVLDGDDDGATAILCDVMDAVHRAGPPTAGLVTIEDWGTDFARYRRASGPLPAALVDRAAALYHDLCGSQGPRVVLHGDLHHDNILLDARRGWLAIDPKGVVGERAYEAGALLRNPTEDAARFATPAIIERRVRILCERLALDRARVLGWCFSQAVLSAVWAALDGHVDRRGIVTAEAALPLVRKVA
jgi:streptomycin 6-kinase